MRPVYMGCDHVSQIDKTEKGLTIVHLCLLLLKCLLKYEVYTSAHKFASAGEGQFSTTEN